MSKSESYYRKVNKDRMAWRDEMPDRCMHCLKQFGHYSPDGGYRWPEVHEILSRAMAPNNWGFRANYLKLCQFCHPVVAAMTHAEQLAIKKLRDRKNFNLSVWLKRRNPAAMEYVTEEDIRRAS